MDKRLRLGLLLDWYGALLTERQRATLEQSLNEDCSLAEIAEREGVSRQAVRDAILRGEDQEDHDQLEQYEAKLGFLARDMALIASINEMRKNSADEDMQKGLDALIERIEGNNGI